MVQKMSEHDSFKDPVGKERFSKHEQFISVLSSGDRQGLVLEGGGVGWGLLGPGPGVTKKATKKERERRKK